MANIDILALEPQKISRNLKGKFMMFYGLPGIGKTALAAKFPKVLIAGFEMGTNGLNGVLAQPIQTWDDWRQVQSQLVRKAEAKEKYECVAIDTADSAWDLCVKYICAQNNVSTLGDIAWGKGYDMAKKEFSDSFRALAYAGYGLIFISHAVEKTIKDENNKDNDIIQINPALQQRPYDIINKMVDIIGYIRAIENEKGEMERWISFRGNNSYFAKSRFAYIAPKVKFSYENIVNAIFDAIDEEIKHSGGEATDEVNPYIQLNFDALMEDAKILWGKVVQEEKVEQAAKILEEEFGKPIRFSEILPEQVEKLNNVINAIRDIV
jgi:hypothetical protein